MNTGIRECTSGLPVQVAYSDTLRSTGVAMGRAWARAWVVWGDMTQRQPVVAKRQNWWATLATSHPRISDCLVVLLRILTAHQFSVESRLSRGLAHAPAPDEPP